MMSSTNVNVIMPMLGSYSLYADWVGESEDLAGKQQWETFLAYELPEALESAIGADGQRSLLGMSMSGGPVLNYVSPQSNFYSSAAALSGCAETNSWLGRRGIAGTVYGGNATPTQIFGEVDSEFSRYNDSLLNSAKLGEQDNLYVYTASGLTSELDINGPNAPQNDDDRRERFRIESMSNVCTLNLKAATDRQGIDTIHYDFRVTGTHAWDYWNEALYRFFPLMMSGFGLDGGDIPDYNSTGTALGSAGGSIREFLADSENSSGSAESFYELD